VGSEELAMAAVPKFYDAERIGTLFYPDLAVIAAAADEAQLPPAAADAVPVQLLVIDMQIDFCHERGRLNVPGALGDIRRLVEWIYRHAEHLTSLICTLDSHLPYQIFHPAWWADAQGVHPAPFTLITAAEVEAGRWRPLVLPEFSRRYVQQLEAGAKKVLTIWPYHVGLGGVGNALDQELWSAVMWHALARKTQPAFWTKGTVPETENYSAIQPEILVPAHPQGRRNTALVTALGQAGYVVVAGEAESHCVLETLEDLVEAWRGQPARLDRLDVLRDCMSPAVHPAVDFHALALKQFAKFEAQGVHFVESTAELPFLRGAPPTAAANDQAPSQPVVGLERLGEWQAENQAAADLEGEDLA
jgi:nicotinamidase-related amidase